MRLPQTCSPSPNMWGGRHPWPPFLPPSPTPSSVSPNPKSTSFVSISRSPCPIRTMRIPLQPVGVVIRAHRLQRRVLPARLPLVKADWCLIPGVWHFWGSTLSAWWGRYKTGLKMYASLLLEYVTSTPDLQNRAKSALLLSLTSHLHFPSLVSRNQFIRRQRLTKVLFSPAHSTNPNLDLRTVLSSRQRHGRSRCRNSTIPTDPTPDWRAGSWISQGATYSGHR